MKKVKVVVLQFDKLYKYFAGELCQPDQVFDPAWNRGGHLWGDRLPAEADRLHQGPVQLDPLSPHEE